MKVSKEVVWKQANQLKSNSNEETERVALSGEVALLDEVALPERGTLSEETMGVNMDG